MRILPLALLGLGTLPVLSPIGAATQSATGLAERLNAPLDHAIVTGDVEAFTVSADGQWAVYRAQQEEPVPGLYAVRADLVHGPTRISGPGDAVGDFAMSAASGRVVFESEQRLFRVGAGGLAVPLTPPVAEGGSVGAFRIAPDGQRLVYLADQAGDGVAELYSVGLYGPPSPILLSDVGAGNVWSFKLSADSAVVVFHGYAGAGSPGELFAAPIDGSAPAVPLCGSFVNGGGVLFDSPEPSYLVDPGSGRVVYLADQITNDKVELFSVPLDLSSAPVRLNALLAGARDVVGFRIATDGSRVLYRANQDQLNRVELYSAPIDGSVAPVKLNGVENQVGETLKFSADGTLVAYDASPNGDGREQVYVAPVDGGAPSVQVSDEPPAGPALSIVDYEFTADASTVVYRAGDFERLYRAPSDASAPPQQLNHPLAPQDEVVEFELAADGVHVVYRVTDPVGTSGLHTTTLDGLQPSTPLHPPLFPGSSAAAVQLVGAQAFFLADLDIREALELHTAPLDAGAPPLRLNGPLLAMPSIADVTGFVVAPDGAHVAYSTSVEVLSVPLAPLATAQVLTPASSYPAGYEDVRFVPDSSRVVFLGAALGEHLFSAPAGGESLALQLSTGAFPPPFGANSYSLDPTGTHALYSLSGYDGPAGILSVPVDGSSLPVGFAGAHMFALEYLTGSPRVVYLQQPINPFSPQATRLYVRDVDGGTPAVEIAPFSGLEVWTTADFDVTPDESVVVFVRDENAEGKFELYSVPIDGSAPPLKLSDALAADRDVSKFHLSPDGTRAVYVADRDENDVFELYVVPVDGSAAPLELSGPMVAGGDVRVASSGAGGKPLVWFTPDSTRVVYLADQEVDERLDLWSVPLDASAAPVRLTDLVADGDVDQNPSSVRITADGLRVVFYADALEDQRNELFSVPIDGSAPALRISGDLLGADQDVEPGFLLLDSPAAVLYRADGQISDRIELWLAPVDGSRPPTRRSFLGHPAADVEADFAVSPDGEHVFYRADALVDERIELFRFPIERKPRALPR